jgi:C-methyltransferase C-terminal domain
VTFLNTTAAGEIVDVVVDINPRKHGGYIPGTGQQVVGPGALRDVRPATVVLMNHNYETEVRAELDALDLHPEVVCV